MAAKKQKKKKPFVFLPPAVKAEIMAAIEAGTITLKQAAAKHDVDGSTIGKWFTRAGKSSAHLSGARMGPALHAGGLSVEQRAAVLDEMLQGREIINDVARRTGITKVTLRGMLRKHYRDNPTDPRRHKAERKTAHDKTPLAPPLHPGAVNVLKARAALAEKRKEPGFAAAVTAKATATRRARAEAEQSRQLSLLAPISNGGGPDPVLYEPDTRSFEPLERTASDLTEAALRQALKERNALLIVMGIMQREREGT